MFDPMSLAFRISIPKPWRTEFGPPRARWLHRECWTLLEVWHLDPCIGGNDDSCGYGLRKKLHFWHWRIEQPPVARRIRAWFERCSYCNRRTRILKRTMRVNRHMSGTVCCGECSDRIAARMREETRRGS